MKMKTLHIAAAAMVLAMTVSCGQNGGRAAKGSQVDSLGVAQNITSENPNDYLPSKAEIDSVSYLLGINFGSFMKGYNFGDDINFAQMKKGILDFVNSKGNQQDPEFVEQFKIDPNEMTRIFNEYLAKRADYTRVINQKKETEFLAKNRAKAGFQETASGLQYLITEAGSALKPGPQDTVVVRYKGTLPNGEVFDETAADADPVTFTLAQVIPGWTEGLQLIGEGGKATLVIPSALAYGENGSGPIEPSTPLTFDVELLEVHPYVEPEAE